MDLTTWFVPHAEACMRELEGLDIEAVARASGFQKRAQRKVALRDILLGIVAVAAAGRLSFERVAASIARCANQKYSKQALHKRLDGSVVGFLTTVFIRCFQPALGEVKRKGSLAAFGRVFLHDSTCIALPPRHATAFPGSANARATFSHIKLQLVCNLLEGRVEQATLSGFTRNDQRAAPDILGLLRPGDLVLRDLGYFVLSVFRAIADRGAFFLSRYRHDTTLLDPATGRPIRLERVLKRQGFFDAWIHLGVKEKLPVRLVAVAVSDAVANARRRKLRQNRDRALNPDERHFFLLGWNIFITNVDSDVWNAEDLQAVYRLRWRIETTFKAFKSHLALNRLADQCIEMMRLSVMTRLIFCAFVYRACHHLELAAGGRRHASLLRVANLFSGLSIHFEAAFLGITTDQLIAQLLDRHAYYEPRKNRNNFQQTLSDICRPLG
jgi:hypothetical protein